MVKHGTLEEVLEKKLSKSDQNYYFIQNTAEKNASDLINVPDNFKFGTILFGGEVGCQVVRGG